LLLDADIELTPGIIARLNYSRKRATNILTLVSLMAEPPMEECCHRAVTDASISSFSLNYYILLGLANNPTSRMAAAAGGCILVETQALRSSRSISQILHNALIDDCTLAAHVKRAGLQTWIGLSRAARSHRGYQDAKTDLGNGGAYSVILN
jgi:hypothetical protein